MSNIHNKSGAAALAILEYEDNLLITWAMSVGRQLSKTQGLIEGSLCSSLPAMDGRYTVNGRKVAYGYQIVAFAKFGRSALVRVPAVKRSENDLVISHLCGTRNCCNPAHLVIETKGLNDERVHCHFCIANVKKVGGWAGVAQFFQAGGCLHIPRCGHLE